MADNTISPGVDVIQSRDQKMCIMLIAQNVPIVKTEKNEFGRTVFSFPRSQAQKYVDQWKTGEAFFLDIREVFRAYEIFNMRIHDEC
jgi:hypothetical protein